MALEAPAPIHSRTALRTAASGADADTACGGPTGAPSALDEGRGARGGFRAGGGRASPLTAPRRRGLASAASAGPRCGAGEREAGGARGRHSRRLKRPPS